jgi:hypothetical protein
MPDSPWTKFDTWRWSIRRRWLRDAVISREYAQIKTPVGIAWAEAVARAPPPRGRNSITEPRTE